MPIQNLCRQNVFEKGVLRKMFRSQTKKQQEAEENSITKDLKVFHYSHKSKGKFSPRTRPEGK